jgi:hypothetical protein
VHPVLLFGEGEDEKLLIKPVFLADSDRDKKNSLRTVRKQKVEGAPKCVVQVKTVGFGFVRVRKTRIG